MDEPFGALDPVDTGRNCSGNLKRWQSGIGGKRSCSLTHDLREALLLASHIIFAGKKGRLAASAGPEEFFAVAASGSPGVRGLFGCHRRRRVTGAMEFHGRSTSPKSWSATVEHVELVCASRWRLRFLNWGAAGDADCAAGRNFER